MGRRLPSLNGLRAFEAAGRHCSFTLAAKELNVTQTAVSRLVRLLEERLGFPLFLRRGSALQLTSQGKALLAGLTESFDSIAQLVDDVQIMRSRQTLTVGIGAALAVNWLIPRLARFHRLHPEIDVRVATGGTTQAMRENWSCAIRRDTECPAGYEADRLFPSTVIPVCAPATAASLQSFSDLNEVALIRVSNMPDDWRYWSETVGAGLHLHSSRDVVFESNAMAMQAAQDGIGVAAAQLSYVSDALKVGRLVTPFPAVARKPEEWLLEYQPARRNDKALTVFREWLDAEAEDQRQVDRSFACTGVPR